MTQMFQQLLLFLLCAALDGALPDCTYPPATVDQRVTGFPVTGTVGLDLGLPEIPSCRRHPEKVAVVAMPETAVHKHDRVVFREHKIGFAGQFISMQAISEAQPM